MNMTEVKKTHTSGLQGTTISRTTHVRLRSDVCVCECVCVDVTKAKGESQTGNQTGDSLTSEAS